jgi:hypothetical protein
MPLSFLLLRLNLAEINFQAIETFVPQRPVALEPGVDVFQRVGRDAARAPLRLAAPCDESGALEHLRCLETAGPLILKGLAISLTVVSPSTSLARMARLVGSARAAKVALSWSVDILI